MVACRPAAVPPHARRSRAVYPDEMRYRPILSLSLRYAMPCDHSYMVVCYVVNVAAGAEMLLLVRWTVQYCTMTIDDAKFR